MASRSVLGGSRAARSCWADEEASITIGMVKLGFSCTYLNGGGVASDTHCVQEYVNISGSPLNPVATI